MTHYFITECKDMDDLTIPCALIYLSSVATGDSITILCRGLNWEELKYTNTLSFKIASKELKQHGIEGDFFPTAAYEIDYEDFQEEKENFPWRILLKE